MVLLLLLIDATAKSFFNCCCVLIDKSSVTLAPLDADAAAAALLVFGNFFGNVFGNFFGYSFGMGMLLLLMLLLLLLLKGSSTRIQHKVSSSPTLLLVESSDMVQAKEGEFGLNQIGYGHNVNKYVCLHACTSIYAIILQCLLMLVAC